MYTNTRQRGGEHLESTMSSHVLVMVKGNDIDTTTI